MDQQPTEKYQKIVKTLKPLLPQLQILDISGLKLTSLDILKDQTFLQILIAEQNQLTNEVFAQLKHCTQLQILSLQDNLIEDHKHLQELKQLPLIELRLLYNKIASLPQYYKLVYQTLPQLYTLDDFDRDGLQIHDIFNK